MPIVYEDDEEGDMGESDPHSTTEDIFRYGVSAHLAPQTRFRGFANLNVYYHRNKPEAYVSPDGMVVAPSRPLGDHVSSYRVGVDGPAPELIGEVLSERAAQQGDLGQKLIIYALLKVPEYILIDVTGRFLPQRLLLKRLQRNRNWRDEQDPDGGVTSRLGFRVMIDTDGRLRVLNAKTGKPYVRPDEANSSLAAAARIAALEAELDRLRAAAQTPAKKKGMKRRKKP
jgi:hypothetical protein